MRGFDDLVSAGKIVYAGVSDIPAWQAARMQTLADVRGYAPLVALQIEYSLAQRTVERELIPMARELGMGVVPWSPLASGVLTGKYSERDLDGKVEASASGSRKNVAAANGALTARNLQIAGVVKQVAQELDTTPAAVALRWVLEQPGVSSPIIGVRTYEQLEQNLSALEVELSDEQRRRLDEVSAIELGFPHDFLKAPMTRHVQRGDLIIEARK
jgi:aryl-alcohol dehydrogenase-like predicted oxidoreductase